MSQPTSTRPYRPGLSTNFAGLASRCVSVSPLLQIHDGVRKKNVTRLRPLRVAQVLQSSEFELGAVIGRGSVGQVHKALHRPSQRTLALKVVRPDFTENTRTRNRTLGDMMNEVRIMSTVGQHPSVVAIVGVLMCGSDPAVAMECLGGGSLEDVIERKGSAVAAWRPPKAVSFSWCSQLCAALHFLHHRETPLVHRDIKPSNLFVSADLTIVKLGDFGLCRPVHFKESRASEDSRLSKRGMSGVTGSYAHMAPEVYSEAAPDGTYAYDEKADIFSAAVCMRTLVTGESAYSREQCSGFHGHVLCLRVANEGFRMATSTIKYAPMAKLISTMWAHAPAERPSAGYCEAQIDAMRTDVVYKSSKPLAFVQRTLCIASKAGGSPKKEISRAGSSPVCQPPLLSLHPSPSDHWRPPI